MLEIKEDRGGIIKKSLLLAGHRTSASLEQPFWEELKTIAATRGVSLNGLIAEIDLKRTGNLSSALRLYVLATLKAQQKGLRPDEPSE